MTWQRVDLSAPEYARPPEPPITCGLLYRGLRHSMSGPPESLKSMFSLILGLDVVTDSDSEWAHPGHFHWVLVNAVAVEPFAWRGALGLRPFTREHSTIARQYARQ